MKKLMIAAAIVCAAAFAQAGALNWSITDVSPYTGDSSTDGYNAWFINSADVASITAANLVDAITTYGNEDNYGNIGLYENATDGFVEGDPSTTITGYVVLIDALDVKDAKHFYVTDALSSTSNNMGVFDPMSLDWSAAATASAGAWQAVPEPTSGLLLLLGVAGLALRRRRA